MDGQAEPWASADTLALSHFHARSSSRHPRVEARLIHNTRTLFLLFNVHDRYVRSVHTQYQDAVCRDSCVEFFVEPVPAKGYFNFEVNAGGTLHLSYIEDPRRGANGFRKWESIPMSIGQSVRVRTTLPAVVEPEMTEPVNWLAKLSIPLEVFEHYVGPLTLAPGTRWRGNFYKCADDTSHPHWASWAPLGEQLNFHQPKYFAPVEFA
jgi:hypothetical protein